MVMVVPGRNLFLLVASWLAARAWGRGYFGWKEILEFVQKVRLASQALPYPHEHLIDGAICWEQTFNDQS